MKQAAFIAAATMAVAGFNLAPAHAANGGPTTAPSPMHTIGTMSNNVSHDAASMTPDAKIQNVIARAAKYAMTPKDMARLVSLFPEAQRQSIAKSSTYSDGYGDKLDSRIESISKAWKQKYGETFTISKANAQNFLSPTFASIHTEALGHNNPNLESAVLAIKDAQGATKLQVPLVCQKINDWKIDVPASLTADRLRANLVAQLTEVDNQAAHWPVSETDAYRLVTRHVMAAILDKPMLAHAQASVAPLHAVNVAQQSSTATVKPISATSSSHHWYQFWDW